MVGDAFDITAVYYLEVNGQYTTCDCPSASFHEGPCKHVRLLEKFKADGKVSRRVVFDIFNKEYVEV